MLDGVAYVLAGADWDLFGTLTFSVIPPVRKAYSRVWRCVAQTATLSGVPYHSLLHCVRRELGEVNGRLHFHILIGATRHRNLITLSHQLRFWWGRQFGAFADVRPYDRSLAGADYVAKCLGYDGANAYEVGKFDQADEVTFSRSLMRLMRRERRSRETPLPTQREKSGMESASTAGVCCQRSFNGLVAGSPFQSAV